MKRAALFVGINDYNQPLSSLKCARSDADTLYTLFLPHYTPGMVKYLHDVDDNAIISSVKDLMKKLEPGDLFFFYFAGHGVEEHGKHLLLSSQAELLGDEWDNALSMNKLKHLTQKRGVQTVIVIDSCRESICCGARTVAAAEPARGVTLKNLVDEKTVNSDYLPPVIICSCSSGQQAFEKSGHGIFTLALKECLTANQHFTVNDIVHNVAGRMSDLVVKYKLSGKQTPELCKAPLCNPLLWSADHGVGTTAAPAPEKKAESPKRTTSLDRENLKTYFLLSIQVEENINDNTELAQEFENIKSLFKNGDQSGAYKALQALQKKIEHLKLIKSYEEKLQALFASYPADIMEKYPDDVKEYDVDFNVAVSLYQSGRVSDALKLLDEMEAIQKRVIAAEVEAKHKAEEEAKRKAEAEAKRKAEEELKKFTEIDCCGVKLEMVKIPAGAFMMGSPKNELGRRDNENLHQVTLTKDYLLGKYQVTQAQWQAVMGNNPSYFKGDNRPVETVSWDDAKSFCDKLNKRYAGNLPQGYKFDLPTEAQWEYACRAGTKTALNNGKNLTREDCYCSNLDEVAWYDANSATKKNNTSFLSKIFGNDESNETHETHPIGQKRPNAWGLYDMHGNVRERCRDLCGSYRYGAVTDPVGPRTGSYRVVRGGSWLSRAESCRSAYRDNNWLLGDRSFDLGFRLALVPQQ